MVLRKIKRWVRGGFPVAVILFLLTIVGSILWLRTAGVPDYVLRRLAGDEVLKVVHFDRVRIGFFPGFTVTVDQPKWGEEIPSLGKLQLCAEAIQVRVPYSKILSGDWTVNDIYLAVLHGKCSLLENEDPVAASVVIDDIQVEAETAPEGRAIIRQLDFAVRAQPFHSDVKTLYFSASGDFRISSFCRLLNDNAEKSAEKLCRPSETSEVSLRENLAWLKEVSWNPQMPPRLSVRFSETQKDGLLANVNIHAADFRCASLQCEKPFVSVSASLIALAEALSTSSSIDTLGDFLCCTENFTAKAEAENVSYGNESFGTLQLTLQNSQGSSAVVSLRLNGQGGRLNTQLRTDGKALAGSMDFSYKAAFLQKALGSHVALPKGLALSDDVDLKAAVNVMFSEDSGKLMGGSFSLEKCSFDSVSYRNGDWGCADVGHLELKGTADVNFEKLRGNMQSPFWEGTACKDPDFLSRSFAEKMCGLMGCFGDISLEAIVKDISFNDEYFGLLSFKTEKCENALAVRDFRIFKPRSESVSPPDGKQQEVSEYPSFQQMLRQRLALPASVVLPEKIELNADATLLFSPDSKDVEAVSLAIKKASFDEFACEIENIGQLKLTDIDLETELCAKVSDVRENRALVTEGKALFVNASKLMSGLRCFADSSVGLHVGAVSCGEKEYGALNVRLHNPGDCLVLEQASLEGDQGKLTVQMRMTDALLSCETESTYPLSMLPLPLERLTSLPEELALPEKVSLRVGADLSLLPQDLQSAEPFAVLKNAQAAIDLRHVAWNGEKLDAVSAQVALTSFDQGHDAAFSLDKLAVSNACGSIELSGKGTVRGQTDLEGNSTMRIDSINRMLRDPDADRIIGGYFEFNELSHTDVNDMRIRISDTTDPLGDFRMRGKAVLSNLRFRGCDTVKTTADVEVLLIEPSKAEQKSGQHTRTGKVFLKSPVIRYDNKEWLAKNKLKGDAESTLKADYVSFDLIENTVSVKGINGQIYMPYALRMFTPAGARALAPFRFEKPVTICGSGVYPLTNDLGKMRSSLSFSTDGDTRYRILGTELCLKNAHGKIWITPRWVTVSDLAAGCWGGRVDGNLQIEIDEGDAINGELAAGGLSLAQIGASYKTELSEAQVNAFIDFTSQGGDLDSLDARGVGEIRHGQLFRMPFLGGLSFSLGIDKVDFDIDRAQFHYVIRNKYLVSNDLCASGESVCLKGVGSLNLDSLRINSYLKLSFSGLGGALFLPVQLFTTEGIKLHGTGSLEDIQWQMSSHSSAVRRAVNESHARREQHQELLKR